MPWNRKTSRRDRKWWSRLLRRNYRAQKRESRIIHRVFDLEFVDGPPRQQLVEMRFVPRRKTVHLYDWKP